MTNIEGLKGAGMAYQGSSSTAQTRQTTEPKLDIESVENVSTQIARETSNINTKEADTEGGSQGSGAQLSQDKQNARIKKAVDEINKKAVSSEAIFGIHEATNRVTIKIVDKETKKVIKELPPEKTLDMIAKVWELAGLMVDERR